jgi:hypothetical protein
MFGRVIYDRQNVFLNGSQVLGVNSFSSNIQIPSKSVSVMGTGHLVCDVDGDLDRSFDFSMVTSNTEVPILAQLGSDITGVFAYSSNLSADEKRWMGTKSRLLSYELNCSVGEVPTSKFSFGVLGFAGAVNDGSALTTGNLDTITVVRPGDLVLSGGNFFVSNRIQNLTYRFQIPLNMRSFMGSGFEKFATLSEAIPIEVEFSMDIDDVTSGVMTTGLCEQDFSGVFYFEKCGTEVRRFGIQNADLTSFSMDASVGPNATATVGYRGYVNSLEELGALVVKDGPPDYNFMCLDGFGSDVNGTLEKTIEINDKPVWGIWGGLTFVWYTPSDPYWRISTTNWGDRYTTSQNTETPDLVTAWNVAGAGELPVGTVTAGAC